MHKDFRKSRSKSRLLSPSVFCVSRSFRIRIRLKAGARHCFRRADRVRVDQSNVMVWNLAETSALRSSLLFSWYVGPICPRHGKEQQIPRLVLL